VLGASISCLLLWVVPAIIIKGWMTIKLILAILSTLLEEAALVAIVLWGLPKLGIQIPLGGLIALIAALGIYAVISYRIGSQALRKKPLIGLPAMVGSKGEVVSSLTPEGLIRIKGEIWKAKSDSRRIDAGEEVAVVGQDGLRLIVSESKRRSEGD